MVGETRRGKRRTVVQAGKKGLTTQDLILIAVLLAAGAVLKLTLGSVLTFAGTKPNFIIAMYCLAIVLARPNPLQAMVVGVIAGLICQIPLMNATPWLNIPSEALGALVMGVLMRTPLRTKRVDLRPAVGAFVSTVVSGYTFVLLLAALNGISIPVALVTYAVMVFGTAVFNTVLVQILVIPLRKVLKRQDVVLADKPADFGQREDATCDFGQHEDAMRAIGRNEAAIDSPCPAIEISDFTFQYREGSQPVVRDVNLKIPAGAFVGITGAAGSGKSTLTYAMNGIIPHCYPGDFYGSVRVCGLDTVENGLTDLSRLVGSVCQDIDSQMVSSVVEDEMLYGLENFGVPREEVESRLARALEDMGIGHLRQRVIASLSGGQKQKVAIASILALRPRVLVLDEPTAELDPASSVAVFDLLKSYARQHGTTVVVVEQKIALLSEYADMLVIVDEGRVVYADEPSEVLRHSDHLLEIGVNCPRSTSLGNRLSREGLYDGPVCRNVGDAVDAVKGVLA